MQIKRREVKLFKRMRKNALLQRGLKRVSNNAPMKKKRQKGRFGERTVRERKVESAVEVFI